MWERLNGIRKSSLNTKKSGEISNNNNFKNSVNSNTTASTNISPFLKKMRKKDSSTSNISKIQE